MPTPGLVYVVEKNTALTYMRRSIFTPKNARKRHLKYTQAPQPFACASRFKQEYAAHVYCTRGYYVCLRLFERPGFSTSLKKHGSYLHAQVDSHTQNQKKKKNCKKHASTTAVFLRIPFQARIRCSCTCHTGLSCLFAFVQTPGLSDVVEKTWVLPTCAGYIFTPKIARKQKL